MVERSISRTLFAATCVLGLAPPSAGQVGKPTVDMIARAPKATVPVVPKAVHARVPPRPGLTLSHYQANRNKIAASLGVQAIQIPDKPVPSSPELAKIGNVVTIQPLGPYTTKVAVSANTTWFAFYCTSRDINVEISQPSAFVSWGGDSYLYVQKNVPNSFAEVMYIATNIPAGSYLILPKFGDPLCKYFIIEGGQMTSEVPLPGDNMITYKKEKSGYLYFGMKIPMNGMYYEVHGVDIMRVQ